MAIVCVDFGTSSIRAALRDGDNTVPLAIAGDDGIDDASIPSAILVPKGAREIYFGQEALRQARLLGEPAFFTASPKKWFFENEIGALDQPVANIGFSRMELVAALLAHAGAAIHRAARVEVGDSEPITEFRLSHPIWPRTIKKSADIAYASLARLLQSNAGKDLGRRVTRPDLETWRDTFKPSERPRTASTEPDVVEPVAAALELIGDPRTNDLSVTLIVDVGAGTTDIAVFCSRVPDERAIDVPRTFYGLGPPKSVFKAGDTIDEVVLALAKSRFPSSHERALAEFIVDIRRYKEELFRGGAVRLPGRGGTLTLKDLESSPEIREMAHDVKTAVRSLLSGASIPWRPDRDKRLDIIFAGGGADIGFLRKAAENGVADALPLVSIETLDTVTPRDFKVAAGRPRMAVAMGGTVPLEEWPKERPAENTTPLPLLAPLTQL
jgi:molecular chaperone DnaK (HSP70)